MDLSETYRSIARKYFPMATVIADRVHVIRVLNQHFLKAWKDIDPVWRMHRGKINLRRHHWRLSTEQLQTLIRY